jgi:predicted transcriptional regulator
MSDKVVKRSYNLPENVQRRLERIARQEDRTVNAQLVRMLERAIAQYEREEKQETSVSGNSEALRSAA